jgi:hypothetical protein
MRWFEKLLKEKTMSHDFQSYLKRKRAEEQRELMQLRKKFYFARSL